MPRPDVSIVIPFHGRLNLVRRAVDSALAQRDVRLELIVVDDGSEGDVSELAAYVRSSGGTFIHQKHSGIAVARNTGLAAAGGAWVSFVDSDDIIYPEKIATQIAASVQTGAEWSCCGFDLLSATEEIVGGDSLLSLAGFFWRYSCPFGATSVIIERTFLNRIGGFDAAFTRSEDWDLLIRMAELSSPAIVCRRLYGYRLDCGNVTGREPEQWREAWQRLCQKHRIHPEPFSYLSIVQQLPQIPARLFFTTELATRFLDD